MNRNKSNGPKSETILVAYNNTALAATGNLIGSGTAVNLAAGQLGVVSAVPGFTRAYGAFVQAGDTKATTPVVRIVQGTPNSANVANVGVHPIGHKAFVQSAPINSAFPITFTSRVTQSPLYSSIAIGHVSTNAGTIPVVDETEYNINITFDGERQNHWQSVSGFDSINAAFKTLDYSALAAYTTPRDHIVQNLAYNVNLHSRYFPYNDRRTGRKPIIAFAIRSATGGAGTALSAVAAGTPFNVMIRQGITYTFTPDASFVATVAAWVAAGTNNITNASTIEVIDLSTAGTASGKATDVIMLVALDEELALVDDRQRAVKVRLRAGVEGGFGTLVSKNEVARPYEGDGLGRQWLIQYKSAAESQIWSQEKYGMNNVLITPPSYIDITKRYNAFVIEHYDEHVVEYSHIAPYLHRTIILVEASNSGVGLANVVTSLDLVLKPWLNSCTVQSGIASSTVDFF